MQRQNRVLSLYKKTIIRRKLKLKNPTMEERKGRRVVLFPLPLQGHINPMLQLANILHSRGFSIVILHTSINSPDPSKYPHLTFHFLHENLTETEASGLDTFCLLLLLNAKCVSPFQDCLSRLLSDESEEPVACLISDAIFHFIHDVADTLGLPRFVLRTGGASSFFIFSAFPLLRERGYIPIQESQLEEAIIEFPPLKVKDLPTFNKCISEPLYQLVLDMVNASKASSGIILNTFEELEQEPLAALRHDFDIPIFPIGPFHKCNSPSSTISSSSHDEAYFSWLDQQAPKSVLYVSFGSLAAIDENEFTEIAWGLANSKQPFLWVVRSGLVKGKDQWLELLPNGFVEELNGRGQIIKWANQLEVLAHGAVGAFWSHNGWNSTLESICKGVPMICMPCFTDQGINARYVSDVWRVGLQLERDLDRKKIEISIKRLMVDKEGEEIRNRIMGLKEKACVALKQNGSSFQWLNRLVDHILSLDYFVFKAQ